ncbi:MAG: DegT/DnrJ/EryC1/StrS aminotransferase family protein [Gammaproteobacteria bacterium]|nr:DegT/DnrJ/EryC1/StrS aminotransferase family protein [Gammaproteobacteria bacterium]
MEGVWPEYGADEVEAVSRVLQSGRVNYWTGNECREFERDFAAHCGTQYAVALMNGSVALDLALEAANIGPGDDVIVTAKSFIASASCVVRAGARPVFADIDRDSQNLTAETIRAALTPDTRAVIVVHHGGWPCDMDPIMALAASKNLLVIEDCAQAHGATDKGRPVGGIGHIGTYSFCQDKIITTGGEGGMLVTNDESVWRRAWSIKDHGKSYEAVYDRQHPPGFRWLHESIGTNWRLTEMQAVIGRLQLRKLPDWTRRRGRNANRIARALEKFASLRVPVVPEVQQHACYRLYAFLCPESLNDGWDRDAVTAAIAAQGIPVFAGGCSEIYREKAFQALHLAPSEPLPVASELSHTSLAFLVHPTLTDADLKATCAAIEFVFGEATRSA